MKTIWTSGLDKEKAIEITSDFKQAYYLRQRLIEILKEKTSVARKESISKEGYDSPSWAFKQADIVGYERALSEVISILSN